MAIIIDNLRYSYAPLKTRIFAVYRIINRLYAARIKIFQYRMVCEPKFKTEVTKFKKKNHTHKIYNIYSSNPTVKTSFNRVPRK